VGANKRPLQVGCLIPGPRWETSVKGKPVLCSRTRRCRALKQQGSGTLNRGKKGTGGLVNEEPNVLDRMSKKAGSRFGLDPGQRHTRKAQRCGSRSFSGNTVKERLSSDAEHGSVRTENARLGLI